MRPTDVRPTTICRTWTTKKSAGGHLSLLACILKKKIMMHGCYYPHVVFGWREGDARRCLKEDWLDEMQVNWYCCDVIGNHAREIVYGAPCKVDQETGQAAVVDVEDMELVKNAHAKAATASPLGYFRALSGDVRLKRHTFYQPGEREEEEEEDNITEDEQEAWHEEEGDEEGEGEDNRDDEEGEEEGHEEQGDDEEEEEDNREDGEGEEEGREEQGDEEEEDNREDEEGEEKGHEGEGEASFAPSVDPGTGAPDCGGTRDDAR